MIGFSGHLNFDRFDNHKFKKSVFNDRLNLNISKVSKPNYYLEYVSNTFEKFTEKKEKLFLCIGDIYDEKFLKSNKSKSDFLSNYYDNKNIQNFTKLNGSFIFIIIDKEKLYLGCDENSIVPLFYTQERNKIIFSYDLSTITANMRSNLILNKYNMANTLLTGGQSFDNSTRVNNVFKVESGSVVIFHKNKKKIIKGKLFSYNSSNHNINTHIENVSYNLDKAIALRIKKIKKVGLGLSGGIDSRILMSAMSKHSKIDITSFTYGKKNFIESEIARDLSKYYNSNHINFIIDQSFYLKSGFDSAFFTGGETPFTTNPQIHVFGSLKKMKLDALTVGSALDCTVGNAWQKEEFYRLKTKKQLLQYYLNGHVLKFSRKEFRKLFKNTKISDNYYDYSYETMKSLLYSISGENIADINSSFFYESRGKRWYNHALTLMLAQNKVILPFYDTNFLDSVSLVPSSYRKDDLFRIRLLKHIDIGASNFTYNSTMSPAWLEPPYNKIQKKNVKLIDEKNNDIWFKSNFSKTLSSKTHDANFYEWICQYKKYQLYIKKLLLSKDSILINLIINKGFINKILNKQISGDNSNLRTLILLLSLETISKILMKKKVKINKIINLKK